jgi:heme O synthase-like polyprenyltransferase
MKTAAVENPIAAQRHRFVTDLGELVKARLTLLVLLTTAVGFYLGSEPPIDYRALFHAVFGTAAAAAGAAALNQWWERRADALMRRTRSRPIPAGRMPPVQALALGAALSVFGVVYLALVSNTLSAVLTAITIAIYIFAYTPLKRASTANTAVGAIPGAIPPMIGIVTYVYQAIELLLSGLFVAVAMRFLQLRTQSAARLLFIASIAYLPLLLAALVLTKL